MNIREFMVNKGKSNLTIKTYLSEINQFKSWIYDSYDIEFGKLNRINFLEYKNYLKNIKGYNGKTINKKIASLMLFNEYLIKNGICSKMVILKSDYMKIQNNTFSLVKLKKSEIEKLRQKILNDENLRLYLAVTILSYSGLRINELVNLKKSDILLKDRIINVNGKGDKFRQVPLNQKIEVTLKEYYKKNDFRNSDYIFKSSRGGHISKNVINRNLKKYTNKVKPHDLRHFFAFQLIEKLSIHEVATVLGHSDVSTTLKYLRADGKKLKNEVYNI